MDLTSYIASMSVSLAQQNVQTAFSMGMLKNTMENSEISGAKMIESLESLPAPSEGVGSLLDVRA